MYLVKVQHIFVSYKQKGPLPQEKNKGKTLPRSEKWASGFISKSHRILRLCFEEQSEIKARPKKQECTTEPLHA